VCGADDDEATGLFFEALLHVRHPVVVALDQQTFVQLGRFLERLEQLSTQFDMTLPKGASHTVVLAGQALVQQFGSDALRQAAKLHFKTTTEVLAST